MVYRIQNALSPRTAGYGSLVPPYRPYTRMVGPGWRSRRLPDRSWHAPGLHSGVQSGVTIVPSPFVRWLQASLNQVLGSRLAVTGMMNRSTIRAVRLFQRQRGLLPIGLAEPATIAALIAAGAPRPPGQWPSPVLQETSTALGDRIQQIGRTAKQVGQAAKFAAIRLNIVRIALQEWQRWDHGMRHESDPTMHPTLLQYYAATPEGPPAGAAWWRTDPWSAAFTSWVVKEAGTGPAFNYSRKHARYIVAAKKNVVPRRTDNPVKAFPAATFVPKLGDLVCKSRAGSGATYRNLAPGMDTHCDIVVGVRPGAILTIGGNVGAITCEGQQTVGLTTVCTESDGRIKVKGSQRGYFAVIRIGA